MTDSKRISVWLDAASGDGQVAWIVSIDTDEVTNTLYAAPSVSRFRIDADEILQQQRPDIVRRAVAIAEAQSLPLVEEYPAGSANWRNIDVAGYRRREAASTMGSARTRAKSAASRRNGKLGGRPQTTIEFRCGGRTNLSAGQLTYWRRRVEKCGLQTMTRPAQSGSTGHYDLHWSIPEHSIPEPRTFCPECSR